MGLKNAWNKRPDTVGGTVITTVIATLIAAFILFVVGFIIDFINKVAILTTVKLIVQWVSNIILPILTYELRVWWLLLLIAATVCIISLLQRFHTKPVQRQAFLDYTSTRQKLNWRWSYEFTPNSNYYEITELYAYCDNCNTRLTFVADRWGSYIGAKCPRCDKDYSAGEIDGDNQIQSIIKDDIRRIIEGEPIPKVL